jgi:hypothetical protein
VFGTVLIMNSPNTPREHVARVLRAYDRQRALGVDIGAAVRVAAAQLRVSRETVVKALAVRETAPRRLRLVA